MQQPYRWDIMELPMAPAYAPKASALQDELALPMPHKLQ